MFEGAAWYALPEKGGQNAAESAIYPNTESLVDRRNAAFGQMKSKTGVEFRAEKETYRKKQEKNRTEKLAKKPKRCR